jgi:chlorobactene glucosyltransferase
MIAAFWQPMADGLSALNHLTALALLTLLSARLLANLRFLHDARHMATRHSEQPARVSVLVPARNEAATIRMCVTSLLRQTYPHLELLILDDGSTDGTGAILDEVHSQHPDLRVMHSDEPPPPGWNGKSYACSQLAEQAAGDWLLFTDADTIHQPKSVAQGLALANALNVPLLSASPYQRTVTWSERIMVSFILDFLPLLTLDLAAMARSAAARVAANGQYLLVHADEYRALGGHNGIAHALIDDFALAQRFQAAGYPVALVNGAALLECRMYSSAREVWEGFSKNLLGALSSGRKRSLWLAPLFAWCYACLFIIPFYNLLFTDQRALTCLEITWLLVLRALVARFARRPLDEVFTTPLAAWGVMAIGMATLYRRWRGRGITWKGRVYSS